MLPIDAVISWVDGEAETYQVALRAFCETKGLDPRRVIAPTRYRQRNEIEYCLLGLLRHAPWIRTIYIVTPGQVPSCLSKPMFASRLDNIKVIDQADLLARCGITTPVFNSLSVEWIVWHIEGLSERFLYLNDDFLMIRAMSPEDFFRDEKLVLRGVWKKMSNLKWGARWRRVDQHRLWQERSARLAGYERQFYLLPHAPFPLLKSTYQTYLHQVGDAWLKEARYPWRDPAHVSCMPLMTHLDWRAQRVIEDHAQRVVTIHAGHHAYRTIRQRLADATQHDDVRCVCIQSLDEAPSQVYEFIEQWIKTR